MPKNYFVHLRICASANEKKDKNLSDSSPAMIHSDYYIEINIIICFLIREILQKNSLAQLNPFPPALMKKMKMYLTKVFASVLMHLYSKYEVHSSSNKVLGAKKRFCAHLKSLLCANDSFLKILIRPMFFSGRVRTRQ